MIHHLGQMCYKVNYSLEKMEIYDNAVDNNCIDAYSIIDRNNVKEALGWALTLLA